MKVAIVGAGNLGLVLAKGLLEQHFAHEELLLISRNSERSQRGAGALGVTCITDVSRVPRLLDTDLVILCVKPQDAPEACDAMKALLSPETVVLSVMAGVPCAVLRKFLGHAKVARAMPNLGAQVRQSATAFFIPDDFSDWQVATVERIVASCGRGWRVDREALIDVSTAVAGSGPAYLCWLAEQIEVVALQNGISLNNAHELVLQTFKGAVAYLEQDRSSFAELRRRVTSPNGTTAAALAVLQEAGAAEIIQAAIQAALDRSVDLGRQSLPT